MPIINNSIFLSGYNLFALDAVCSSQVLATSLKLEIRLHAHQIGTNTQSATKAIFTLIRLAHAFGTGLLCM